MFGGLEIFEVDRLERIIGQEIFGTLESVAQSDDNVKNVMEWVSSLLDMTDEDVSEQIMEFDKSTIERQGLEQWLEMEKKLYGDRIQKDEVYKQKVDTLIQWAKDNDYEKPSWERKNAA